MNYFGHAAIATLRDDSPAFVLGAMLPDLLAMVGKNKLSRELEVITHAELRSGVEFHLLTDGLFHQTEVFTRLNSISLKEIRALGVSRGAARASAHIGVEMLLDQVLARQSRFLDSYLSALSFAGAGTIFDEMNDDARLPLLTLCSHLHEHGAQVHDTAPERLGFRLERTLSNRPKLCPTPVELGHITHVLGSLGPLEEDVKRLLIELSALSK